jgi:hypothetical protein
VFFRVVAFGFRLTSPSAAGFVDQDVRAARELHEVVGTVGVAEMTIDRSGASKR